MDVRVLGPIEVYNGHRLAVGGPRQRRILAALAMHAQTVVSTDRLMAITWSGQELPDQADANLRSYVYRIRTGLGDELSAKIETRPPGYMLLADGDELDHSRFERLVERAERVAAQGDHTSAVAYVGEALSLWRGEPYEEFADEEWVEAEVARLREVRARALERRCDALIQLGRPGEALGELDALIDEYPFRERPRLLRMTALYATGRQAEAVSSFQDFRRLLVEEVGIDPSEPLVDLERRMLQQDPALGGIDDRARALRSYELDEVIGEGAFAIVWRGTQPDLNREVAVKQIKARLANDPDFIRRFEVEAQLISSLEHPRIVPLYDYWREPDAAFLVMRLLRGGTLEERLARGPLDDPELRRLASHIGSALRHAHRSGVVHRDVKPANVMLDDEGNFYLTDFGIAFGVEGEDDTAAKLSTGSPPYAAPEQLRREALDGRSDIYSLGVTLYHAALGESPYAGVESEAEVVRLQLDEPVPAPSIRRPDVPKWIDTVVSRATATRQTDRYHEVDELIEDAHVDRPDGVAEEPTLDRPLPGIGRNPFKGLRAFGEVDAPDFHGRDRLVRRFVEVLARPGSAGRLLALVGPSGSGKSSAVRAGLLPAIRRGVIGGSDRWFVATMAPGAQPFEQLEEALAPLAHTVDEVPTASSAAEERRITDAVARVLPDDGSQLLLVVDQLEELYTLTTSESVRTRFLDGLLVAIREPRSRLRVVLTIRADFWDRPLAHPRFATLLETAAVTVGPLAADELEQAVVHPVVAQGLAYEPGLVARITADVADQPGALPLLQFALTELFDRAEAGRITSSAYDAIGGITGALIQRAERTYIQLGPLEQGVCRRLLGRLVTLGEGVEDTRRRVLLAELGTGRGTDQVVEAFGNARLLTFDRDPQTRLPTVEIAHEALLRSWPRLRDWIDDDRDTLREQRRLTTAATEWDRGGRDPDELYRGSRLEQAVELREHDAATLSEVEAAFVDAGAHRETLARQRARRRTRVLQGLLAVTATLLVVSIVATFVAVDRADEAATERAVAEQAQEALEGEKAALLATQADLLETQRGLEAELLRRQVLDLAQDAPPVLATLLAVELDAAYRDDLGAQTLDLIADTLLAQPGWKGTIPGVWVDQSPLGPWIVTVEQDAVVVRQPDTLAEIRRIAIDPLTGADGQLPVVPALDQDGRRMVVGQPGGLRIVDLSTGEIGPLISVELGFDRGRAVTWTNDSRAVVFISGPQHLDVLAVQGLGATPVAADYDVGSPVEPWLGAHPSDALLFVALTSGRKAVFDVSRAAEGEIVQASGRTDLGGGPGVVLTAFDADGAGLVNTSFGTLDVFETGDTEEAVTTVLETGTTPGWVERLADGLVFVSGGLGTPAVLVDVATDEVVAGPWPAGGGSSAFVEPLLIRGGDELVVVLTGSRTGSDSSNPVIRETATIHRFSLVGGDALSETLPPFPNDGADRRRPYYLPEADVVVSGRSVWAFDGREAAPIDLGVPIEFIRAQVVDDGEVVVVAGPDGAITVHELPSGQRIGPGVDVLVAGVGIGDPLAVSPDLRHLVVVSRIPTVELHLFDLATGTRRESFPISGELGTVSSIRAGTAVAFGSGLNFDPRQSVVIDLEAAEVVSSEPGWVWDVSADGNAILTTRSGGISLVDIATEDLRWTAATGLPPTSFGVRDDHLVGHGFIEHKVVDVESRSVVGPTIEGPSGYAGAGVLTQVVNGRAHVRVTDPFAWPDVACAAAGRALTEAEWAMFLPDLPYAPTCSG